MISPRSICQYSSMAHCKFFKFPLPLNSQKRTKESTPIIKQLMTGHKGNSEFCFPEMLNVPRGEAEGNIEVEGKQNSLFPEGPVIKCFVIPPDSKIDKAPKKIICLRPLHTLAALAKLSGCQNQPVLSKNHDNSLFLRS